MGQQILSDFLIPLVLSLATVIVTQYILYRKLRTELAIQNQTRFLETAFKDNYAVIFHLDMIMMGEDVKTQIQKIQEIINTHNYNLSTGFVINWVMYKDTLLGENSEEKKHAHQILQKNILYTWRIFAVKYLKNNLGLKYDEILEMEKASKGTFDRSEILKWIQEKSKRSAR